MIPPWSPALAGIPIVRVVLNERQDLGPTLPGSSGTAAFVGAVEPASWFTRGTFAPCAPPGSADAASMEATDDARVERELLLAERLDIRSAEA
jgi:hypothetical protein